MFFLPRIRPPLTVPGKAVTAYFQIALHAPELDEIVAGRIARNDLGQLRTDWFADGDVNTPRFFTLWDPTHKTMWHVDPTAAVANSQELTAGGWPHENDWSFFECISSWTKEESDRLGTLCLHVSLTPHAGAVTPFAGAESWVSPEWALVFEYSEATALGDLRWTITSLVPGPPDASLFLLPPSVALPAA